MKLAGKVRVPSGLFPLIMIMPLVLLFSTVTCRSAAAGRLTRNHLLGYRFPSLLASDRSWQAGHEAAYRPSLFGFIGTLLSSIAIFTLSPLMILVEILCFIIGLGTAITSALRAAGSEYL
ncbi:SdpI family protein [Glutamicibacter sp.]|uniref:SdpI family protein n=1 Tax=Glutamicibacter sp. TaxID=1931995 RepID=UPI0028BE2131|nr:SdpI family protein [Glutamicibacter sp.]